MKSREEITQVRAAHRFNEKTLADYLRSHIQGFSGELKVNQFEFGQSNPTFLLWAGGKEYVLRKKPPGKLLPSAHAVDREYRIIAALKETNVPVPDALLLCEDDSIIGTPFYVMNRVEGRIFRHVTATTASDAEERGAIFDAMNDTLAKIHRVDWQALGLADFGKPGNYMARQVDRWTRQYMASKTDDMEAMDHLIDWLEKNIPADDSATIVHGDFRLENLIIHLTEPRVVAVLDWELSTLGHPLADLAYNCMNYYIPVRESRVSGYRGLNLTELGIPEEMDYVSAYCRRTGRDSIPNWNFFIAFSMFRLIAIIQGVYKRGLDGIASSDKAKYYGEYARFLADLAWKTVTGEKL
ncbi:MAG: phosphotransferase [Deltaproteobacteria bacterium]|nr:phosphotransferase [Deltaproteobacteria bacterium]